MSTVLITGCSSGFGLETARYFLDRDWQVVATMRSPRPNILPASDRLRVLALDVTSADSIARAVADAGPIDVLVNNAGIGWLNALEGTPMDKAREIFETNTFGTMAMTQAVLPQFRERGAGIVINVSSSTTLLPLQFLSVYSASKAAVNMFTESLALEIAPFGIRAHLIQAGRSPETSFGTTAQSAVTREGGFPAPYAEMVKGLFARYTAQPDRAVTHAGDVAEVIWRAATDAAAPMRLPAGADAVALST